MYDPREDLFEREEDDSQSNGIGNTLDSSSIRTISRPTSLSYSLSIFEESDDEIFFPSYEEDNKSSTKYPRNKQVRRVESPSTIPSTTPDPAPIERSEDDLAAREQPSRHVDYLSHEWTEKEIWSSWKYMVSKRKSCPNSERLENAAWRTWEQKRRNLKTVSPETVKWLKDHDVTWLYGPLQPSYSTLDRRFGADDSCHNSGPHSACQSKKPCLKKQTLSELMLRRSESSASLLKEAATVIEAQKSRRTVASTHDSYFNLTRSSPAMVQSPTSSSSPDSDDGSWNLKNVRFHEMVEQCIALEDLSHPDEDGLEDGYASDSEEDEVVIIRKPLKSRRNSKQWLPSFQQKRAPISKTIEKLPQAPLKSPSETESEESSIYEQGSNSSRCRPRIATLPSPQPSPLVFYDDAKSDNDDNEYWKLPSWPQNRKDSVQKCHDKLESIRIQSPPSGMSQDSSFPHRPLLERRDETLENFPHVCKGPKIEGREPRMALEVPPCRSQLATFSFTGMTKDSSHPLDEEDEWEIYPCPFSDSEPIPPAPLSNSAKTALVNEVMQEFWVLFEENEQCSSMLAKRGAEWKSSSYAKKIRAETSHKPHLSPDSGGADHGERINHDLPILVRSAIESRIQSQRTPDAAELIDELESIIRSCQSTLSSRYNSTTTTTTTTSPSSPPSTVHSISASPEEEEEEDEDTRFADPKSGSWSPRTSSDSGYGSEERNEAWRVRDTSGSREEKEKGVRDWELYSGEWDEEAVAWDCV